MLFGPHNFLTHVKHLVMGGGRDSAGRSVNDSGYMVDGKNIIGDSVLAAGVTYTIDADSFPILSVAATNTGLANVSFRVPRDYDENTDILFVHIVARMGGATDVPTVTLVAKKRVTGAAAAVITPVSGSPSAALSAAYQEFTLEFRGAGLLRGQLVDFLFTSAAHATDALQCSAIHVSYRSCLVSYNQVDSANNDLR